MGLGVAAFNAVDAVEPLPEKWVEVEVTKRGLGCGDFSDGQRERDRETVQG